MKINRFDIAYFVGCLLAGALACEVFKAGLVFESIVMMHLLPIGWFMALLSRAWSDRRRDSGVKAKP